MHAVSNSTLLSIGVFILWLGLTSIGFWWYQFRWYQSLDEQWFTFLGGELAQLQLASTADNAVVSRPTVVHFVDPECPCSRFSAPHIKDIEQQFTQPRYFRVTAAVAASPGNGSHVLPEGLAPADIQRLIPASPAVAIWDGSGELAYFGPYSSGSFCGQGNDFVKATLVSLDAGQNPRWVNQEAVGCLCAWPTLSS